jgi:hypothetical protein
MVLSPVKTSPQSSQICSAAAHTLGRRGIRQVAAFDPQRPFPDSLAAMLGVGDRILVVSAEFPSKSNLQEFSTFGASCLIDSKSCT